MPTSSSKNLGTEQENKTEVSMTTRRAKPKPEATETPEPTVEEVAAAEATATPDEANADAVGEGTAQVIESETLLEILEEGRERIDAIDEAILELVVRRMEVVLTLLAAKHQRGLTTRDKIRQEEILARLVTLAADLTGTGENRNNSVSLQKNQIRELWESLIRLGVENFRKNIIDRRR